MYFSFNSNRNSFLKNADLFRLSSINNVTYIKEQVYDFNQNININFLDKLNKENDLYIKDFLNTFLGYI